MFSISLLGRTVYANIPELKESILQRAHILRQAAASSNSELKAGVFLDGVTP